MRKLQVVFTILALGLLSGNAFALTGVREKKLSKHYTVSNGDKLSIDNRYGKVHINTWDKNEVTVDVVIRIEAKNDDKAQQLLDRINISERNAGHEISYVTEIKNNKVVNLANQKMSIDYTINAPRKNALDITNKFGNVYLDDFDGSLQMDVSYGALKTEKIGGDDKYIKVAFGSASIESLDRGKVEVSYSALNINKAQKLDVLNKFGKSTIGSIQDLKINQQYGDLQLGTVERINGTVSFAGLDVDKLLKSADMNLKYCSRADFGYLGSSVDLVKLNASFGSVFCHVDDDASLAVDINVNFGQVSNHSRYVNLTSSKPDDDSRNAVSYTGKIGRGSGKMQLNVSYGNINFN